MILEHLGSDYVLRLFSFPVSPKKMLDFLQFCQVVCTKIYENVTAVSILDLDRKIAANKRFVCIYL